MYKVLENKVLKELIEIYYPEKNIFQGKYEIDVVVSYITDHIEKNLLISMLSIELNNKNYLIKLMVGNIIKSEVASFDESEFKKIYLNEFLPDLELLISNLLEKSIKNMGYNKIKLNKNLLKKKDIKFKLDKVLEYKDSKSNKATI